MTALTRYQRLESPGVWHESPNSQRKDVYVSLGETSLILKDANDAALTHWALAAVVRVSPGHDPAIFAPGLQDDERLEITEPDMIDALDQLRHALARQEAHRGRLRLALLASVIVASVLLAVFWLPGALVSHTAQSLPEATRQEIGRRLTSALVPYTGTVCRNRPAQQALERLQSRLFGAAPWDILVVNGGYSVIALPGGRLLVGSDLLVDHDTPDAVAGHLLTAGLRAETIDPMIWFLNQIGTGETFRMLTTGALPQPVMDDVARSLALGEDLPDVSAAQILARFTNAQVSTRAYGLEALNSGEAWIELVEADPYPTGTPKLLLGDGDWLRLQGICDGSDTN